MGNLFGRLREVKGSFIFMEKEDDSNRLSHDSHVVGFVCSVWQALRNRQSSVDALVMRL